MRNSALIIVFVGVFLGYSCAKIQSEREINLPKTDLAKVALVPLPLNVVSSYSAFPLDSFTCIKTPLDDEILKREAVYLQEKIQLKTGLTLAINPEETHQIESVIYLEKAEDSLFNDEEAYQLKISQDTAFIRSRTSEGTFRALQTFRQLIPETSNDTLTSNAVWVIPSGTITDRPNFEYRGTMLDVARHFFTVEDVKKYIELLAYYKYNILHLHLSDDQGWRIEIKAWPKLTELGGSTQVGGGPGGYYSQEDFKEIVAHATKHYITIVPEIDMPGHTSAAIAAYPFLNGTNRAPKLYTGMRVGFSSFDTRSESVYGFINDVVKEITAMTPGPYFHIGGDESDATKKNNYRYFVSRVEKIVQSHGKQMIGWDEIGQVALDSSSVSQFWRHADFTNRAIANKMKVILSPAKHAYLDMKYDSLSKHGLRWAGYIPVDKAYQWNPENYEGIAKGHILGIEAPLWSETIAKMSELEYLVFPRIIGYAELGWTPAVQRDWANYKVRLAKQKPFLDRMNVNYYQSPLIDW